MKRAVKRGFIAGGLAVLTLPGLMAEHVWPWVVMSAGILCGLIAAVIDP